MRKKRLFFLYILVSIFSLTTSARLHAIFHHPALSTYLLSCVLRLWGRYFLIVKLFSGLEQREFFLSLHFFLILMNSPPLQTLSASDSDYLSLLSPSLHLSVFEKQIIGRGDGLFCRSVGGLWLLGTSHTITYKHSALRLCGHESISLCENEDGKKEFYLQKISENLCFYVTVI